MNLDLDDSHDDSYQRNQAALTAVANRDREAITELIRKERSIIRPWTGELRGLALLGGLGNIRFAPDNPWRISPEATLHQAVRHTWSAVEQRCPRFFGTAAEETLGLALVFEEDHYLLGYLYLSRYFSGTTTIPRDLSALPALANAGILQWTWGGPPILCDAVAAVSPLGRPVPAPIRELARIHSFLVGEDGEMRFDFFEETPGYWFRGRYDSAENVLEAPSGRFGTYDRLIYMASYGPSGKFNYFNLDELDTAGNPRVITYDAQDGLSPEGVDFYHWFDQCAPVYLFGSRRRHPPTIGHLR